jgi:hypothetical protein
MLKFLKKRRRIVVITVLLLVLVASCVIMLGLIGVRQIERCPGGKVDLKGMGEIIDYQSDNGVLRLRLKKQGSEDIEVVLVDECTGRIKGALTIDDNALKLPEE